MSALGRPRREVGRPPRPRRVRRSGGGEWTPGADPAALRAWADELGRAPRSYDWSPATARAGGFPLAGAEKWEREHPRWPHHALVCARYGSWRAALEAAGLPTAPPLAIPRRERVAIAQRLRGPPIGGGDRRRARRDRAYRPLLLARGDVLALRRPADLAERELVRGLHPVRRSRRPSRARSCVRCGAGRARPARRRASAIGASRAASGSASIPPGRPPATSTRTSASWPHALRGRRAAPAPADVDARGDRRRATGVGRRAWPRPAPR